MKVSRIEVKKNRLNPYSTGIWSATMLTALRVALLSMVLILILLEYGLQPTYSSLTALSISLNPYSTGIWSATNVETEENNIITAVLILILLEYGLQLSIKIDGDRFCVCLNPYSTGIWSATVRMAAFSCAWAWVLILILLEYGLQRCQNWCCIS